MTDIFNDNFTFSKLPTKKKNTIVLRRRETKSIIMLNPMPWVSIYRRAYASEMPHNFSHYYPNRALEYHEAPNDDDMCAIPNMQVEPVPTAIFMI